MWTAYQRRVVLRAAPSSLPERMRILAGLEEFWEERDWLTAEREVDGLVEAHGHFSDERR